MSKGEVDGPVVRKDPDQGGSIGSDGAERPTVTGPAPDYVKGGAGWDGRVVEVGDLRSGGRILPGRRLR